MEGKIRAIVKRPDEKYGHVTNISTSLKNLQRIVEGYIEIVPITSTTVIICNEEGKLRHMQPNFFLPYDIVCGEAIVVGRDGEDLCDLDLTFGEWKEMLEEWGNV